MKDRLFNIFIRYLILLCLAVIPSILYFIFTPLTLYPVSFILERVYQNAELIKGTSIISFGSNSIELIQACIAGSAYLLLFILNLSTPIEIKTRIKSLIFLLITFLILNIIRILIFTNLFIIGYQYFDITHRFVWYFGSTFLVIIIWFSNVLLFKIKTIPFYTDIKSLMKKRLIS